MNIKQIISVSGQWYAHLYNNNNDIDLTWPIVCWALNDSEVLIGQICGMVAYNGGLVSALDVPTISKMSLDFIGYVNQSIIDEWKKP